MGALRRLSYRVRWGSLPQRQRTGLVRFYDLLAETPIHHKYWMNGGLLLGCIRAGVPMPHDTDADFSFWEADRGALLESIGVLQNAGFELLSQAPNNDGSKTKWALKHRGFKFEFYMMRPAGNKMQWISHVRRPQALEMLNEVPMHGLDEIRLFDRNWLKPDDHETYLRSLYGDWRTPNSNYCYWMDSQAVVSKYPWKVN